MKGHIRSLTVPRWRPSFAIHYSMIIPTFDTSVEFSQPSLWRRRVYRCLGETTRSVRCGVGRRKPAVGRAGQSREKTALASPPLALIASLRAPLSTCIWTGVYILLLPWRWRQYIHPKRGWMPDYTAIHSRRRHSSQTNTETFRRCEFCFEPTSLSMAAGYGSIPGRDKRVLFSSWRPDLLKESHPVA
jgi:hypothetical protein